jgi:uncharacterized membrane protein
LKYLKGILILFLLLILITAVPVSSSVKAAGNLERGMATDSMISAGGEASYRISITNEDVILHIYTLSCPVFPKEFKTHFLLDKKVITDLEVKAGDSAVIELRVSVPLSAAAGTNSIQAAAKRDDGRINTLPLSLTVNGDYSLSITNRLNGLSGINGQSLSFDIAVSNTGSKDISDVGLKLSLPYKWVVQSINPQKLSLKTGENGMFKVQISIPQSQVSGNYTLKTTAVSGEISSMQMEIPIIVQNNPNYIFGVIVLIAAAGIGTILYFHKHGRR